MTILQKNPTQAPTPTQKAQIFEYVLVLWTGELEDCDGQPVPKETETVFPVFDHEPSEADWFEWLSGWFGSGYKPLSRPYRLNSQEDEF